MEPTSPTRKTQRSLTLISISFLVLGPVILLFGIASMIFWKDFLLSGQSAMATIIGEVTKEERNKSISIAPVFRFQGLSGQMIEQPSTIYRGSPQWRVGDQVQILFDPVRPDRLTVLSKTQIGLLTGVTSALGILLTAIGTLVLRYRTSRFPA